ncbi:hypothetical protein ACFYTU_59400 [Nonomuraea angiospora]|uniref:hypothetical protein n=1 Tax=Nonomuraea angiospora TaxID=46172 RepID=UPI003693B778
MSWRAGPLRRATSDPRSAAGGRTVVALSEYGITDVSRPVDHQVAHVHVRDPAELFFDPESPSAAKSRAGVALLRKKPGLRYLMNVVGLGGTVRGGGGEGAVPEAYMGGGLYIVDF